MFRVKEKYQCKICGKELKRYSKKHIESHTVTEEEYFLKHDPLRYIAARILELYKPNFFSYIEMIGSKIGQGYWVTKNFDKEQFKNIDSCRFIVYPLNISSILDHLKHHRTLGVKPRVENRSDFISFDIDENDEETLAYINESLEALGIEEDQILNSWSGYKGFHVTVFFENSISWSKTKSLFHTTLNTCSEIIDKINSFNKKYPRKDLIELRGASSQGAKLPLGINLKNKTEYFEIKSPEDVYRRKKIGNGNFCFVCNKFGQEIDPVKKLHAIKKVTLRKINEILQTNRDKEKIEIKNCPKGINSNLQEERIEMLRNKELLQENEKIREDAEIVRSPILHINGVPHDTLFKPIEAGQRHKRLLLIATYNMKIHNMTEEDNLNSLIEFSNSGEHSFQSSYEENIKDIEKIIESLYKNPDMVTFKYKLKQVMLSKEEIYEILSVKKKTARKVYFAMCMVDKIYGDNSRSFFITHDYIKRIIPLRSNGKDIHNAIKQLVEIGKILIVNPEKNWAIKSGKISKTPGKFKILYKLIDKNLAGYILPKKNENDVEITFNSFELLCAKVLKKDELKIFFHNYKELIKYKHQKLY